MPDARGVVQLLLAYGADPEAKDPKNGTSPLMQAALRGNADVVGLLLEAGADPRAVNRHGLTAGRMAEIGRSAGVGTQEHGRVLELLRAWSKEAD